jgi:hypothetical protein
VVFLEGFGYGQGYFFVSTKGKRSQGLRFGYQLTDWMPLEVTGRSISYYWDKVENVVP